MVKRTSLLVVICCLSTPSLAKKPPPSALPTGVSIDSVTYSGDGCPPGSVAIGLSPDGEAFTVAFSSLFAAVGSGIAATDATHHCQLHIKLTVPPGWSYALASVDYRGYVALDPGLTATRQSRYHISGESPVKAVASTWTGAIDDNYAVRDLGAGAPAPAYWSRCGKGKNLIIENQLDVQGASGEGLVTVDALDGEIFHLVWQQCS
jgi:hypothetical protein